MIIMVIMTGTHPYSPLYDILNVILYTLYCNDMIITIIIHCHTTIVLYTHYTSSPYTSPVYTCTRVWPNPITRIRIPAYIPGFEREKRREKEEEL
jgi:hypothetical protein